MMMPQPVAAYKTVAAYKKASHNVIYVHKKT